MNAVTARLINRGAIILSKHFQEEFKQLVEKLYPHLSSTEVEALIKSEREHLERWIELNGTEDQKSLLDLMRSDVDVRQENYWENYLSDLRDNDNVPEDLKEILAQFQEIEGFLSGLPMDPRSLSESSVSGILAEARAIVASFYPSDLPENVDFYEAVCAVWYIESAYLNFGNHSIEDILNLTTKLDEISNKLSPSQLEELREVRDLYLQDPFSRDAEWRNKAIDWFSTLDEDLQENIEEAFEVVNPPQIAAAPMSPDTSGLSQNTVESAQPFVEKGASAPEVQMSKSLDGDGARESTETPAEIASAAAEPSLQEKISAGLHGIDTGEAVRVTDPPSLQSKIVAGLHGSGEVGGGGKLPQQGKIDTEPINPQGTESGSDPSDVP